MNYSKQYHVFPATFHVISRKVDYLCIIRWIQLNELNNAKLYYITPTTTNSLMMSFIFLNEVFEAIQQFFICSASVYIVLQDCFKKTYLSIFYCMFSCYVKTLLTKGNRTFHLFHLPLRLTFYSKKEKKVSFQHEITKYS